MDGRGTITRGTITRGTITRARLAQAVATRAVLLRSKVSRATATRAVLLRAKTGKRYYYAFNANNALNALSKKKSIAKWTKFSNAQGDISDAHLYKMLYYINKHIYNI